MSNCSTDSRKNKQILHVLEPLALNKRDLMSTTVDTGNGFYDYVIHEIQDVLDSQDIESDEDLEYILEQLEFKFYEMVSNLTRSKRVHDRIRKELKAVQKRVVKVGKPSSKNTGVSGRARR